MRSNAVSDSIRNHSLITAPLKNTRCVTKYLEILCQPVAVNSRVVYLCVCVVQVKAKFERIIIPTVPTGQQQTNSVIVSPFAIQSILVDDKAWMFHGRHRISIVVRSLFIRASCRFDSEEITTKGVVVSITHDIYVVYHYWEHAHNTSHPLKPRARTNLRGNTARTYAARKTKNKSAYEALPKDKLVQLEKSLNIQSLEDWYKQSKRSRMYPSYGLNDH